MTTRLGRGLVMALLLLTLSLPGVPLLADDQEGTVTQLQASTLPASDVTTTSATLRGYLDTLGELSSLAQPLAAEQIYTSSMPEDTPQPPLLLVFVNALIQPHITESLDQYVSDLEIEGYSVRIRAVSGGTPNEMREILQGELANGLVGALLIGDLPVFWFEMHDDVVEADGTLGYSLFPTDFYYTDLDGTWADSDGNGICDRHLDGEGSRGPEIWVGRLTANTLAGNINEEVMLLRNYFAKNHAYRIGDLRLNNCALAYADAELVPYCAGVCHAYNTTVVITDEAVTTPSDYKDRLTHNYEWVEIHIHSTSWAHYFKTGAVSYSDIRAIDPVALFYTLHACSNARYVERNYMAGWYVFANTYGLAALGSTKTYPEWPPAVADEFYASVGQTACLGEALKRAIIPFDWAQRRWVYAMTLLGDPTLSLRRQGATPALVSFQWWANPQRKRETPQRPMNAAGAFTYHLAGLSPDTTYYCRAKVTMNGVIAYGDVLSFTTGHIRAKVAVLGDYDSQLTELLLANNISAEEKGWAPVIRDITEYDVVVVNNPPDPGERWFLKFLSAASDSHVGVAFTSSRPVSSAYGISLLQWYLGDPVGQSDAEASGDVYYEVSEPNSIVFGDRDEGDIITIIGSGARSYAWFWGYSGDVMGRVGSLDLGTRGDAVAIGKYGGSTHVLLASLGLQNLGNVSDWTESARITFIKAILAGISDLAIITAELPSAMVGSEYRAALSARGGARPYTWALVDGQLPDGLGLDGETGVISGTPAKGGTCNFVIKVMDHVETSQSVPFSIHIAAAGWCFIATAADGTPMAAEIQVLREFRDEYLMTNPVGQALVGFYYRVSPRIAEFITEHRGLKAIIRAGLAPAVAMSAVAINTTPAGKIAIVSLLVMVSVALAIWTMRRCRRGAERN